MRETCEISSRSSREIARKSSIHPLPALAKFSPRSRGSFAIFLTQKDQFRPYFDQFSLNFRKQIYKRNSNIKNRLATFWRVRTNVPGSGRSVVQDARILGRLSKFLEKRFFWLFCVFLLQDMCTHHTASAEIRLATFWRVKANVPGSGRSMV